jgi:IS1 family transposase
VKHLKKCVFYTDAWDAFAKVLPKKRHIVGKKGTHIIESNNANTRHHLGRFTRKTKVVSRSENAVDSALKLWLAMTDNSIFSQFQRTALSIYF